MSFSASAACVAPTMPTTGAKTPMTAQRVASSSSPSPKGSDSTASARVRGSNTATCPSKRIAAPETSGVPRGDAGAIHGVPRREIVAAIEHDVGARDERRELGGPDSRLDGFDAHVRIDGGEPRLRRSHLRRSDVRRRIEDLALQVGEIHRIRDRTA